MNLIDKDVLHDQYLSRGRTKNGKWVDGFVVFMPNTTTVKILSWCASFPEECRQEFDVYDVDPSTVGRCMGESDFFGKLVFDGDIISVDGDTDEGRLFRVAFGKFGGEQNVEHEVGYVGFYFEPANEQTKQNAAFGLRTDPLYWLHGYDCRVIGNIHDNPELMGGDRDADGLMEFITEKSETEVDQIIASVCRGAALSMPTIDPVEAAGGCYCKECTHWKDVACGCTEHYKYCAIGKYMVCEDGFCSYGDKTTVEGV